MLEECRKSLNFLHISIDDGHDNLDLLRDLDKFRGEDAHLAVQIVVTRESLPTLPDKIKAVHDAAVTAVVMPAAHVEGTDNHYPDPALFGAAVRRLKKKYRGAILTSDRFLRAMNEPKNNGNGYGCTTSSIIIDSDGMLYYPCYVLGEKPVSLLERPLVDYLESPPGVAARETARKCGRKCGWYQYFATPSCTSLATMKDFLGMYAGFVMRSRWHRHKRANGKQSTV
jgi:hypothetical protein